MNEILGYYDLGPEDQSQAIMAAAKYVSYLLMEGFKSADGGVLVALPGERVATVPYSFDITGYADFDD